jgi:hypothetical protein
MIHVEHSAAGPFLDPEKWTEEDEIPWDFDAGGSLDVGFEDDWTGFEIEAEEGE